jgi:ligand-binding SRPBCC domain-containing protein
MAEHVFSSSLSVNAPRDKVFAFFSNAENLERITPPNLGFHILTPTPIDMRVGTLIDYQLKLRGFPIKWRTEITRWDPPNLFEDTQLSGPYKQWIHEHKVVSTGPDETLMTDTVRYRLPFEPFGDLANLFVSRDIANIFAFRSKVIGEVMAGEPPQ